MSLDPQENRLTISPIAGDGPLHHFEHEAMACTWGLYISGEQLKYARQAAQAAFAEVDRLEQEFSRFITHSDVARINALAPGNPLRISADVFECLTQAAWLNTDTQGAFDVTAGTPARLAGMQRLELQRATRSVTVLFDGVVVDLGGIGKGYAIDRAVAVLRDWSITAALIHSGQSTIYALGSPAGQHGWSVSIRDPADHTAISGRLRLCDAALSGSGAQLHGQHILDPRTGRPAASALNSWALAPTAARADALSTAFMVLSPGEVANYCRRHVDVAGLRYVRTSAGHTLHQYGQKIEWLETTKRD